jgi:hypothetical protein
MAFLLFLIWGVFSFFFKKKKTKKIYYFDVTER